MFGGLGIRHIVVPVKGKELHIYPVCDVQVGTPGVDIPAFKEYVAEIAADPYARVIGVGDYTDGVSPSNRKILTANFVKGDLYDTAREMLDAASRETVNVFNKLVTPTVGKWDAVLSGHHFWEYAERQLDGTTVHKPSDVDIAAFVGAEYVEEGSALIVSYVFPPVKKGGEPCVLRVWATHGEGSGQTFASPLNALERQMRGFNADVYITGHHHKLVAGRAVKLAEDPDSTTHLRATDGLLVSAGSFLRGYLLDAVSYAERGKMVPLAVGGTIIRVVRQADGSFKVRCEI